MTDQNFQVLEEGTIQSLTSVSCENLTTESIEFSLALD